METLLTALSAFLLIFISALGWVAIVIDRLGLMHKAYVYEFISDVILWVVPRILLLPFPIWIIYKIFIIFNIKITFGG